MVYDEVILLVYGHSDYIDILIPALKRIELHWNSIGLALCINDTILVPPRVLTKFKYIYKYDDNKGVYERILPLLNTIKESYIIFNLDINILVNNVDEVFFERIFNTVKNLNIDQLRLWSSGVPVPDRETLNDDMFEINKGYYMSLNTALWKRLSLLNIASRFTNHSWRCGECSEIQEYVKNNFKNFVVRTINSIGVTTNEHHFCPELPFVHMTDAGKWKMHGNFQKEKIKELCNEFGIDITKRLP